MEEVLKVRLVRIALLADVFPPLRSSGAVQLRDLAAELGSQGHDVTVLVASPGLRRPWQIEKLGAVTVVRLAAPRTKDVGLIRRAFAELLMPFSMRRNLHRSPLGGVKWDGIVWYSPSIFLGPLANALKTTSGCRGYLIVRDIFPEWAVDMGLMGRGLPYRLLKFVANYQYEVADVIGIQSPGNRGYFERWTRRLPEKVEVLQNWLAPAMPGFCSISVAGTPLAGRTIFVYAGNMGIAQGMSVLLDLAEGLKARQDIGFLLVGRGSDAMALRRSAQERGLANVLFYDEIEPAEIAGLYAQCHVGLVALDPRHRTHNIPGKFLSYMQAGLPVLAAVNAGNDLVALIESEGVGRVGTDGSAITLAGLAVDLVLEVRREGNDYDVRCRKLADRLFSPRVAASQVARALTR